jgi:hypothetical protein
MQWLAVDPLTRAIRGFIEVFLLHHVRQDFIFDADLSNCVRGLVRGFCCDHGDFLPAHWISVPGGDRISTAATPGAFDASPVSILMIRAWAWEQVNSAACNIRAGLTSEGYLARPVSVATASTRVARVPITRRFSIGGRL